MNSQYHRRKFCSKHIKPLVSFFHYSMKPETAELFACFLPSRRDKSRKSVDLQGTSAFLLVASLIKA